MNRGYVKLWRKTLDSFVFKNPNIFLFWSWCLMKATYVQKCQVVGYQEILLEPGQFIFGREVASFETGLSVQCIRTCMKKLEKSKNLTIKTTNKFSIVSIVNWPLYQECENENNHQNNQQMTNKQPTNNHKQECKEYKEEDLKILSASKTDAAHSDNGNSAPFFLTRKKRKLTGKRLDTFEKFWDAFAYKKGKAEAADAWLDIPQLTNSTVEKILCAAKAEASAREQIIRSGKTPKMAQGWISGRRWEDEVIVPGSSSFWAEIDREMGNGN